jgi:hypothetical protein
MIIETERLSDTKFLHYHLARAVSETPVLVRELTKDLPRAKYVIFGKKVDLSKSAAKELFAQTDRTRGLPARPSNVSVSSML